MNAVVARAPGRLDVMGGIADYSGSLVLQRPIAEVTVAELQRLDEPVVRIVSESPDAQGRSRSYEWNLAPIEYSEARNLFPADSDNHWAAYVVGVFVVLMRECAVSFSGGAGIRISSTVPEGKGVASSAALEVAVMHAVAAAFDIQLKPQDMALLCQKAENLVAGAPCGVMDQMTSVCGENGSLLALLCQPAELQPPVPIPDDVQFWGLDSGERHAVGGSDYTSVRTAAFMGHRIIGAGGYLANVSPAEFEQEHLRRLPEQMSGAEFLARHGGTADTVTTVDSGRVYRVRQCAAHPVYEHDRVQTFRKLLLAHPAEEERQMLGNLMYESHESYSACGLGSPGTDLLVNLVRAKGSNAGLYGARITGGGSGGTVAILGRADVERAIENIAADYAEMRGYRPYIFSGSSAGACKKGEHS